MKKKSSPKSAKKRGAPKGNKNAIGTGRLIIEVALCQWFLYGNGSVVGTPDCNVRIANTPIIGVSWARSGKIMVIDSDFSERVETETLRIEFCYEDADNFQKNLVTVQVECFEDLNLLRTDAHSYFDLAGESI